MKKKLLNIFKNLIIICIMSFLILTILPNSVFAATASVMGVVRSQLGAWYKIVRNFCLVFLLIIFIVQSVKLIAGNTPDKMALVKSSFKDWIIAFILVFFLHYILIGVLEFNRIGLNLAKGIGAGVSGLSIGETGEYNDEYNLYEAALSKAYEIEFTSGTIGLIMYFLLVFYTIRFAWVYFKRLINVIFLMLTGPLVVTKEEFGKMYSGIGDGSVRKWFKEVIYNIMIQSIHAIFYASLIGLTIKLAADDQSFIGALLTLFLFGFILKIDKFIRKIFNFVGGSTKVSTVTSTAQNIKEKYQKQKANAKSMANNVRMNFKAMKGRTLKQNFREGTGFLGRKIDKATTTLGGKNVKVTGEEIYAQEEIMKERKGFEKVRGLSAGAVHGIGIAGAAAAEGLKKIGRHLKESTKEEVEAIRRLYNKSVEELENNKEMIKRIPTLIKSYKKKKKPKTKVKFEGIDPYDLGIDVSRDPKEVVDELKEKIEENPADIMAAVYETVGAQAFLYPEVGSPRMGMAVLAECKYEEQATRRLTGGEIKDKKVLKFNANRKTKQSGKKNKMTQTVKRSMKQTTSQKYNQALYEDEYEELPMAAGAESVYTFNSFGVKSTKKIVSKMQRKVIASKPHLRVLNKVGKNIEAGEIEARGSVQTTNIDLKYKAKINASRVKKQSSILYIAQFQKMRANGKWAQVASIMQSPGYVRASRLRNQMATVETMPAQQIRMRSMVRQRQAYTVGSNVMLVKKKQSSVTKMKNMFSQGVTTKDKLVEKVIERSKNTSLAVQPIFGVDVSKQKTKAVSKRITESTSRIRSFFGKDIKQVETGRIKQKTISKDQVVVFNRMPQGVRSKVRTIAENRSRQVIRNRTQAVAANVIAPEIVNTARTFSFSKIQQATNVGEPVTLFTRMPQGVKSKVRTVAETRSRQTVRERAQAIMASRTQQIVKSRARTVVTGTTAQVGTGARPVFTASRTQQTIKNRAQTIIAGGILQSATVETQPAVMSRATSTSRTKVKAIAMSVTPQSVKTRLQAFMSKSPDTIIDKVDRLKVNLQPRTVISRVQRKAENKLQQVQQAIVNIVPREVLEKNPIVKKMQEVGIVKAKDKQVVQFVVTNSGKVVQQIVNFDGQIVSQVATAKEKTKTTETAEGRTTKRKEKAKETVATIADSDLYTVIKATKKRKETRVQQVVTMDGTIVNQEVDEKGRIVVPDKYVEKKTSVDTQSIIGQIHDIAMAHVADNLTKVSETKDKTVANISEVTQVINQIASGEPVIKLDPAMKEPTHIFETAQAFMDLGIPQAEKPSVENKITDFDDLMSSLNASSLLDQLQASTNTVAEKVADAVLIDRAIEEEKPRLEYMTMEDPDTQRATINDLISNGVIPTQINDGEHDDILGDAISSLEDRIDVLSGGNSNPVFDTIVDREYADIVTRSLENGEVTPEGINNMSIEDKLGSLSDTILNAAKEQLRESANDVKEAVKEDVKNIEEKVADTVTGFVEDLAEAAGITGKTEEEKQEIKEQLEYEKAKKEAEKKKESKDTAKKEEQPKEKEEKEDDREAGPQKITLTFTGAVEGGTRSVSLSNLYSLKDFYYEALPLEGMADYAKTEQYFNETYSSSLEMGYYSFSKPALPKMDGWTIYVARKDDQIDSGDKERDTDSEREQSRQVDVEEKFRENMSEIVKLFEYFVTENDIKNFDEFLKDKSLKRDFIQRLIWLKPIRDAGISFTDVKEFVENMEDYKALRSVIKDRPARELIKEELKNAQNRFEVVDTKAEESGRGKADILEGFMPDDAVEEARKIEVNSFANELQRVTLGNDSTEVIKDLLSTLDTVKEMTGGNKEQNNARKIVYTSYMDND